MTKLANKPSRVTLTTTLLVLLAAVLHATWNAMVKSTGDRLVMMAWIAGSTSMIAAPLTFVVGLPGREAVPFLLASLCIHTAYMLLLVRAYNHGDFGQVYPLARGFAPIVVTIVGFLAVREALPPNTLLGVAMIVAGIISLSWRRDDSTTPAGDLRSVGYALATGVAIAAYSVVDGVGGRNATSPVTYAVWLFLIHGLPFFLIALARRGAPRLFASRRVILTGVGGAIMSMLAYGIVIWAMKSAPLGPVSALRETSVIIAALISAVVLGERRGPLTVIAACLVAAGIIMLRIESA